MTNKNGHSSGKIEIISGREGRNQNGRLGTHAISFEEYATNPCSCEGGSKKKDIS